jgi:hypothetical protein
VGGLYLSELAEQRGLQRGRKVQRGEVPLLQHEPRLCGGGWKPSAPPSLSPIRLSGECCKRAPNQHASHAPYLYQTNRGSRLLSAPYVVAPEGARKEPLNQHPARKEPQISLSTQSNSRLLSPPTSLSHERVDQVDSHGRWKGPCL